MGNKCTFTGRVVFVGKTEALGKTEKKFYKRQIIVDDSDAGSKYSNEVAFEYHGDKCKYLDQFKEGDEYRGDGHDAEVIGREQTGQHSHHGQGDHYA